MRCKINKIRTCTGTLIEDLTGKTYNYITVISLTDKKTKKRGGWIWKCKCNLCGKEFESTSANIKSGTKKSCGCLKYAEKEKFVKDISGQKFGKLTVIEKMKERKHRKVQWKCICDCGKICITDGCRLRQGRAKSCGCEKEKAMNNRHTIENLSGKKFGKLLVLDKTKRASYGATLRLCECECGEKVWVNAQNLKKGITKSCGKCFISAGEEKIKKILQDNNLIFERQKRFDKCRNPKTNYPLPFDFYLPDYNCCIEYDGEQHFKYTGRDWNTKENFEGTQYRDGIKNKFCEDNNIRLVRIPYTDFNKIDTDYILNRIGDKVEE